MKCLKKRYDRLGAMIALSNCQNIRCGSNRLECRIYKCPRCNGYHLTSKKLNISNV